MDEKREWSCSIALEFLMIIQRGGSIKLTPLDLPMTASNDKVADSI